MESPRRSGIPVPKSSSRPLMRKSLSKSTEGLFDADDTHNSDLDVFTLLEENISLKEKTEALLDKNNAGKMIWPINNVTKLRLNIYH